MGTFKSLYDKDHDKKNTYYIKNMFITKKAMNELRGWKLFGALATPKDLEFLMSMPHCYSVYGVPVKCVRFSKEDCVFFSETEKMPVRAFEYASKCGKEWILKSGRTPVRITYPTKYWDDVKHGYIYVDGRTSVSKV